MSFHALELQSSSDKCWILEPPKYHALQVVAEEELLAAAVEDISLLHSKSHLENSQTSDLISACKQSTLAYICSSASSKTLWARPVSS